MNSPLAVCISIIFSSAQVLADGCPEQVFSARNDLTKPSSVPVSSIAEFVKAATWSDGVRLPADEIGTDVFLDVVEFPPTTSVAAAARVIWLIGRIMDTGANRVVFVDDGKRLFAIDALVLKDIGCRFVIGEQAGENPIALMREFYDGVVYAESGERIAPEYTGSLLGDTNAAIVTNNEIFVPAWVISAVK